MDIELNTLLVALMFVTILSMGIGNILVSLADILNHATTSRRSRQHVAWIVLMLVIHFNLFWNTKAILDVSEWSFEGFLLTIAGPVLLFFATSILLTGPTETDEADLPHFFTRLGQRFFLMFAAVQVWNLVISFTLTGGLIPADFANVALLVLALVLAYSASQKVHVAGTWIAWLLALAVLGFRWITPAG